MIDNDKTPTATVRTIMVQPRGSPILRPDITPPKEAIMNHIKCPFHEHGCTKTGTEKQVKLHIRDDRLFHLALIGKVITRLHTLKGETMCEHLKAVAKLESDNKRAISIMDWYNSQYVFHVKDISKAIKPGKANKQRLIFGSPFETHRYGYKMVAVLAPFGDGESLRESMGIFVALLKGENDPILAWPFSFPVKFTIIANDRHKIDLEKTFVPNATAENETFFGRPKGERNASFGVQNFCPLNEIDKYCMLDEIFIRIDIDIVEGKRESQKIPYNQVNQSTI